MARTDNLHNYLEDVATAIKDKKGDQTPIKASDFDTEIANLPSGGGDISEYFSDTISYVDTSVAGACSNIKKLPAFNFSGSSMDYLFYKLYNLESVDLSNFNTANATSAYYMFGYVGNKKTNNFKELDFKTLTGEKLRDLRNMFAYSYFRKIDLSNYEARDVRNNNIDGRLTFSNCYYLEEIYLDKLDYQKIGGNFTNMFSNCGSRNLNGQPTKVYVKDEGMQNWILNNTNGHPDNWTTDNIIIAGSEADTRER